MNAATSTVETGITVPAASDLNPLQRDTNPYEIRWGFQMAVRDKVLPARDCGIAVAPFGEFFPVKSFNRPEENHTTDDTQPRERLVLRSADECELSLREALAGAGAQGTANWGFLTAFRSHTDGGKIAVISAVLLPNLSRIRKIQEGLGVQVIEAACPSDDPTMDAEPREQCVSCWSKWLNSPVIDRYIDQVGDHTVYNVSEVDSTGEISSRSIVVPAADLRTALESIRASSRQAVKQLNVIWNEIAREYSSSNGSQGSRKDITEYEHNYRRDLHRARPEDRQLELARAAAGQNQAAGNGNNDMLNALAQSQLQMGQMMTQLAGAVGEIKQVVMAPIVANPADVPPDDVARTTPITEEVQTDTAPASNLAPAAAEMEAARNQGKNGPKTKEK